MVGFAARSRACFLIRFLCRAVVSVMARLIRILMPRTAKMISKGDLLVLDFSQYQPAIVPTPGTGRVPNDLPLGLVQTL